ncbi:MAG: MBL fold metallo-hydrolase, partial [Desulfuromonadaceae bacterium]|nr:MBL fold metallo-hydrolase [Desulfuromonadaceae bacterium]
MRAELALTVVADNTALRRGLMAEHGLAIWLEYAGTQFLLDSGQGLVLMPNLKTLGLEMQALAGVAVSHGHYDHTGGIVSLMQARTRPLPIYAHPDILATKFSCSDGICHEVGVDAATRRLLHSSQVDLLLTSAPRQLIPGLWLTGRIPRQYPVETRATPFFLDREARTADPLDDDQALFAEVEGGIVVILGCAHAGLINTLAYVQ